jgi:hypothetical protein
MAAAITFKLVADDSTADDSFDVTPATLYRGMATSQEYHELYAQNTGDAALTDASYTLIKVTTTANISYSYGNRKITSDEAGTTPYSGLDYSTANSGAGVGWSYAGSSILFASTLVEASMAALTKYYIWTKYKIHAQETAQAVSFRHVIGGS